MNVMSKWGALLLAFLSGSALAAGGDLGQTVQQATNWTAIGMFVVFVGLTLGITKWAAGQTKSTSDFYTAGGGISGFKNGLSGESWHYQHDCRQRRLYHPRYRQPCVDL